MTDDVDSCLFYCTVILFYCTCADGLTDSMSLKAEKSVNVTDESRSSWYSSWNGTDGSSDDGGRWRQTRRSEWKRVGDSMNLPLLRETSGRRELIAVWAERPATGCQLNAGDDVLRQRLIPTFPTIDVPTFQGRDTFPTIFP